MVGGQRCPREERADAREEARLNGRVARVARAPERQSLRIGHPHRMPLLHAAPDEPRQSGDSVPSQSVDRTS